MKDITQFKKIGNGLQFRWRLIPPKSPIKVTANAHMMGISYQLADVINMGDHPLQADWLWITRPARDQKKVPRCPRDAQRDATWEEARKQETEHMEINEAAAEGEKISSLQNTIPYGML